MKSNPWLADAPKESIDDINAVSRVRSRLQWIGNSSTYPERWSFKKDIPKCWQHWAKRVDFRWETAWIVRDHQGLVYFPNGNWAECLDFYLVTPGHVIGLRDLTTADGCDWAQEWRAAMHDRITERLTLGNPQ